MLYVEKSTEGKCEECVEESTTKITFGNKEIYLCDSHTWELLWDLARETEGDGN